MDMALALGPVMAMELTEKDRICAYGHGFAYDFGSGDGSGDGDCDGDGDGCGSGCGDCEVDGSGNDRDWETEDAKLRHKVKALVLGCGYGAGYKKFAQMYNMPKKEAKEAVTLYREKIYKVPKLWENYDSKLIGLGLMSDGVDLKNNEDIKLKLELPSGRTLNYGFVLQQQDKDTGRSRHQVTVNRNGKKRHVTLWGGILAENASQALARDIFSFMMLQIEKAGINIIFHVHDEVVCECDEEVADETLNQIVKIMSTPPEWIPDIPLDAEGEILNKYTK